MRTPPRSKPSGACCPNHHSRKAFTLVELLAVIAIIVIMFGLAVPAINGLKNAGDVSKSVYDVAGTLDQARAYAMGNSTYVYVGFQEVDVANSDSKVPQVAGTGRLAVAVVASRDGTTPPVGTTLTLSNLASLQKIQRFENLHLTDFYGKTAGSGPMTGRNGKLTAKEYSLGNATTSKVFFTWPLTGTPQYSFAKVIQFSPQGVATLCDVVGIPPYLEIALQQTNGNIVPPPPGDLGTTNLAAIQIDGIIGSNRIFRP